MRPAILTFAAAIVMCAASALILAVAASISLARDEDEHGAGCVGPCCDEGPDDLTALADAVGVLVTAPLSWELAKTPEVRAMTLVNSAAWLATARDIDGLPTYRGGR